MKRLTILVAIGICLGLKEYRAAALDFVVRMTDSLTFSPAALTIGQGDSVTWTNTGLAAHTSTSGSPPSGDGLWSSPTEGSAGTFKVTFTNFAPNTYPYFCTFHSAFGMTGSITVTNSAVTVMPPTLRNPVWNNGQFQFSLDGKSGSNYVTERSQDLKNWLPISTNTAPADQFTVTDPSASGATGFYRVRSGL